MKTKTTLTHIWQVGVTTLLFIGLSACGSLTKQLGDDDGAKDQEEVEVKIGVEYDSLNLTGGLGLAALSTPDFVMDITGCSSGYTTTVTSTTASPVTSINLYKYDTDCVAELTSFEWPQGTSWTKQGGGNLASGTALFVDGSSNEMNVSVYQTLSSPLADAETASFVFQEIILDSDFTVTGYTFSETVEVLGIEAPNVSIDSIDLTAIASGTGLPTFTLHLECNVAVSGGSSEICTTPNGDTQDMTNYSVAIVFDDPAGYNGELTYSEAQAIITGSGTAVVLGDIAAVGTNGGLTITGINSDQGPLYTKRNLLVVIEYADPVITNGKSYRYFNADIGVP